MCVESQEAEGEVPGVGQDRNDDHGRTWRISFVRLGWRDGLPVIWGRNDDGHRPSSGGRQSASARVGLGQRRRRFGFRVEHVERLRRAYYEHAPQDLMLYSASWLY